MARPYVPEPVGGETGPFRSPAAFSGRRRFGIIVVQEFPVIRVPDG
jgi:hypothetical protein